MSGDSWGLRLAEVAAAHAAEFGPAAPPVDPDTIPTVVTVEEEPETVGERTPAKPAAEDSDARVAVIKHLRDSPVFPLHDVELTAGLLDVARCVDTNGPVNARTVDLALIALVRDKPWLVKDIVLPNGPHGPSGAAVGSARKQYGAPGLGRDFLERKYRMHS